MDKEIEKQFIDAYDELADPVFRRCYFKTSDRDVAHDLTQDTFMKVWDYLVNGNEIRHLKAFIFTVANNLIKDYYKKKKALPMGGMENYDPANIPDEVENTEVLAEAELIVRMFEELSEEDRDLLLMRLVEGMSPKEIGDLLGERENTISVRIHRATKKLRILIS